MTEPAGLRPYRYSADDEELYGLLESDGIKALLARSSEMAKRYPLTLVPLADGLTVARITSLSQSLPFIEETTSLVNSSLVEDYPRTAQIDLVKAMVTIGDGRTFDLRETWNGFTYLIFNQGEVVGLSLARREATLDQYGIGHLTGRGTIPLIVLEEDVRRGQAAGLMTLSLSSLAEDSISEIWVSCAPTKTLVNKMFSKFASKRWLDGDWLRYTADLRYSHRFVNLMVARGYMSPEGRDELIGKR